MGEKNSPTSIIKDLQIRRHLSDSFGVSPANDGGITAQSSFLVGGFLRQDMTAIGARVNDFPGSGSAESFGDTFIGFHLWHLFFLLLWRLWFWA